MEPVPSWLEFLAFGDSRELRFPLPLMGVGLLALVTSYEAIDGVQAHLEHIVPFSILILTGLVLRWRLIRRFPEPLAPEPGS